ncbi:hypothetical protein D3C73_926220 [compost metagenome]
MEAQTLLDKAAALGVQIEFNGPWCREVGQTEWVRRKRLYKRFYRKLLKKHREERQRAKSTHNLQSP